MVKKGDLLFQIDPAPYQAATRQRARHAERTQAKANRYKSLLDNRTPSRRRTMTIPRPPIWSAKANVEAAALNLEYTQIHSPVMARPAPSCCSRAIWCRSRVSTTPLVTITQIQPIKVSFSLPQADLPRIQARAARPGPEGADRTA